MWANAEKLLSVFTLIRSCSGMERMRASLKKSSFVLTAAIRRQAWVPSGAAFYVLTRMYLRRTVDGTRIFSNLSVRKPDQGLRRTEPVRCLPAPTACARRTGPEKLRKDRSRSAVRLLLQRVFELRYASHKQCHRGEIRDTHCRI